MDAAEPDAIFEGDTVKLSLRLAVADAEGFEFCNTEEGLGCATTDAEGNAELVVPANADVALTVDREGYVPLLWMRHTGGEDMIVPEPFGYPLLADVEQNYTDIGMEQDPTKGMLWCYVANGAGATISVEPESGVIAYWNDMNVVDPDATELGGQTIGVFNIEPGDLAVTIEHPTKECTVFAGFLQGDAPNEHVTRVIAGRFSWGCALSCVGEPTTTETVDEYADAAGCEADPPYGVTADCAACVCTGCLDEINDCNVAPGCSQVAACSTEKACSQGECYTVDTCQALIDGLPGGASGDNATTANQMGECFSTSCAAECMLSTM